MTASATSSIAAFGLPTTHVLPERQLRLEEFAALLGDCIADRLLGFLGAAVREQRLLVNDESRASLERELQSWLAHDLRVERTLLDVLAVLADADIPSRVLKGVALAHTAYADPAVRVFGDVDLLVPSRHFTRAATVLADALPGVRAMPELRPGFDDRFGKEVMLRVRGALELDLHRTFVDGALGLTVDLDDLFAPPYRFPLGKYEMEALPMPQRLLHACYAAALGDWPPRLVSLRDVGEIVLRERPFLVDVLLMAKRWRCEIVVARAITTTWRELRIEPRPPIVEWAERYTPSRAERLLLAAHEGPARSFTRHAAAVVVIPGVRDRAAYLHAIAFPQRSYLRARTMSTRDHVRRAARRILR